MVYAVKSHSQQPPLLSIQESFHTRHPCQRTFLPKVPSHHRAANVSHAVNKSFCSLRQAAHVADPREERACWEPPCFPKPISCFGLSGSGSNLSCYAQSSGHVSESAQATYYVCPWSENTGMSETRSSFMAKALTTGPRELLHSYP